MTDSARLSTARLVALSLPTLVFAGYELARRSFLAPYLTGHLGLPITTVGWLVAFANFAPIPAELLVGAIGDHGRIGIDTRRLWMMGGTALIVTAALIFLAAGRSFGPSSLAGALTLLVTGWAICNVTHGAWALECTRDSATRNRIFGMRSLFGIVGAIGFSGLGVMALAPHTAPFLTIMAIASVAAPLVHGFMIVIVPVRHRSSRPLTRTALIDPLRLLFINCGNRRLAALFALNGTHSAITATGFIYISGAALGMPDWATWGILAQSVSAAAGIALAIRFGHSFAAESQLRLVLWANLLLAAALLAMPPRQPGLLMAWSALFGLFSAVDFMALRVMLGSRLDAGETARTGHGQAAAHYAGFHLPYNLCGAAGAGLLLAGYAALGFDPQASPGPEQAFVPVLLLPSAVTIAILLASLWILGKFRKDSAVAPTPPPPSPIVKTEQL